MAGSHTTTLGAVRAVVRQRLDLVNSLFCTDAELNGYIVSSLAELHDLLVGADSEYLLSNRTITLNGSASYSLGTDFYKLKKVDQDLGGGQYRDVLRTTLADKNRWSDPVFALSWSGIAGPMRYFIADQLFYVVPQSSTGSLILWYYPSAPQPSQDSDSFDVVDGFDEYLVINAGIRVAMKREDDPTPWFRLKSEMKARVEAMGQDRDMADSWGMTIGPRGL